MLQPLQESPLGSPRHGETTTIVAVREFKRHNPLEFGGSPDPMMVEGWLKRIERILNVLQIKDDEMRIFVASYQLVGEAYMWWEMISEAHDPATMTWDEFKKLFFQKYFLETVRDAKVKEFYQLTQRNMSLMEYESKFTELL